MKIFHKKAKFDYEITDTTEAGIQLSGAEVKSAAAGHVSLEGSFVKIIGNEAYLVNAQIFPYVFARTEGYDPKRTRRLLLHKKEIMSLKGKIEGSNLTLVPVSLYSARRKIKLSVGLAKGRKKFEKREKKRREDIRRELDREYRGKIK